MKLIILVALALVAVAVAIPVEPATIVRSSYEQAPEGSYNFNYESSDGSVREEVGELRQVLDEDNKPRDVVVSHGSFTYTDPEGHTQSIQYTADENGYHAEGDSIPQVPSRR